MSDRKIKVLVADDSSFMRLVLSDMINSDSDLSIVAIAENGKQAYEKTLQYKPDVLLLDIVMPDYDGLYAVSKIMKEVPTPIVILSASSTSDSTKVFDALNAGAYDFLEKPKGSYGSKIRDIESQVITKIKSAATISRDRLSKKSTSNNNYNHTFEKHLDYNIVVIGSSTGGTGAIEEILKKLPGNFPIPIVIAQHMPVDFVHSFAKRLDDLLPLTVKVAEDDEILKEGTVYLAPGDVNTSIEKSGTTGKAKIRFTTKKFEEYNFPSVDCLFVSAAKVYKEKALSIILSGMGKDGTLGLEQLKAVGANTLAQDEKTSVVFGMPKSAIDKGYIKKVMPMYEMGGYLVGCLS